VGYCEETFGVFGYMFCIEHVALQGRRPFKQAVCVIIVQHHDPKPTKRYPIEVIGILAKQRRRRKSQRQPLERRPKKKKRIWNEGVPPKDMKCTSCKSKIENNMYRKGK
jgi:hypothetical protein